MATAASGPVTRTSEGLTDPTDWYLFTFEAYSRIIARKHGITVPAVDLFALSSSEREERVRLLQELAHLPPA